MAETEATLRLKAVLDTTEVQQKLQQLRGGQAQGPMGSQPPAGIAAQQGNLGGLSQTLSKLNTSITQLRQSIDRLNGRFQGQFQQAQSRTRISSPSPIWGTRGGGAWAGGQSFIQQAYADIGHQNAQWGMVRALMTNDAERRKIIKNNVLLHDPSYKLRVDQMSDQQVLDEYIEYQKLRSSHTSLRRARLANRNMPSGGGGGRGGRGGGGGGGGFFDDLSDVPNTAWNRFINPYVGMDPAEAQRIRRRNMRRSMGMWLGGMYASQLFAGMGRATEGTDAAPLFNSAGEGVGSALNTASLLANAGSSTGAQLLMGGFAGVAAAAASLVTEFQKLGDEVEKEAIQIDQERMSNWEAVKKAQNIGWQAREGWMADRVIDMSSRGLESAGDQEQVLGRIDFYRRKRDLAFKQLQDMQDPTSYAQNQRAEAEFQIKEAGLRENSKTDIFGWKEINWHPYETDEANKIRQSAETAIKHYIEQYQKVKDELNQFDQLFKTWENAKDQMEHDRMRHHQQFTAEYDQFEMEERSRVAANFAAQLEAEENFGTKWNRRGWSNVVQSFADDVLMDRKTGPKQKFEMLRDQLESYRGDRNKALQNAYQLNKQILAGGLDEIELGELKKKRRLALDEARHQGSLVDILENALRQIDTKRWEPNLKNLTSLSQFGFNMGENDDSVEIMERYWTRQIDLTREIKLEIQKGVKTESVYN